MRRRLICYRLRKLTGLFSPGQIAMVLNVTTAQAHNALHHLRRRGEVVKVRDAGRGRFNKVRSVWRVQSLDPYQEAS